MCVRTRACVCVCTTETERREREKNEVQKGTQRLVYPERCIQVKRSARDETVLVEPTEREEKS